MSSPSVLTPIGCSTLPHSRGAVLCRDRVVRIPLGDFSLEKQGCGLGKEHQLFEPVVNIAQSPDDESPMLEKDIIKGEFWCKRQASRSFFKEKDPGWLFALLFATKSRKTI